MQLDACSATMTAAQAIAAAAIVATQADRTGNRAWARIADALTAWAKTHTPDPMHSPTEGDTP